MKTTQWDITVVIAYGGNVDISQTVAEIWRFFDFSKMHFHNVGILGSEGSRGSKCATVPNFVTIGQTFVDIWRFSNFFQDGGRLPSQICGARVWTTHE